MVGPAWSETRRGRGCTAEQPATRTGSVGACRRPDYPICATPTSRPWKLSPRAVSTVTFEGLPSTTQGETEAEALREAQDLLVTALSFCTDHGKPLPRPAPAGGRPVAAVGLLVAAKLALHEAMLERGVGNVELAGCLVLEEKAVRRLRDPLHRSHIGAVEAALRALSRRSVVEVLDVA